MKDELQNTMERPKRYDNIDGTGEMFMGLMILSFALLCYLQTVLPEHSMWRNGFASLLFMYAVLIPALGLGFLLQRVVKKRITWPRTGYVARHSVWRLMFAPRPASVETSSGLPSRRGVWFAMFALALFSVVVGAGFVCLIVIAKRHPGATSLGRGIYLGFWVPIYAFWVFRLGSKYSWKWLSLLCMTLGLITIGLIVPGGIIELSRPVMLFVGLVWLISGGATLVSYLRHTQPPMRERE
jgi:hypothetical protein